MTRHMTAFLMTVSLFLMLAMRVQAASATCLPTAGMADVLAQRFGEYPLATALTPQGLALQIYVGATGTWTMTILRPDGIACVGASGHDFNLLHRNGLVPAQPT